MRSMLFLLIGVVHDRLGHATRQLLPCHTVSLTWPKVGARLWQRRLQLIEPLVKVLMQPLP